MNVALRLARSLIKVGVVSSANESDGTVQVLFQEYDNTVSDDLPVMKSAPFPKVDSEVVCIFRGNAPIEGFCLGGFYTEEDPPVVGESP